MKSLVSAEVIAAKILLVRGKRVMIDKDLASLYKVETRYLTRQVRRNLDRFPEDFMFQLSKEEFKNLMCHFGTSKRGGTRKLPYVFTEQGVAMLSGVLHSRKAIQANIVIMRAFVKLRKVISMHKEVYFKLAELERRIEQHDSEIGDIFDAIRELMGMPDAKKIIKGFAQK